MATKKHKIKLIKHLLGLSLTMVVIVLMILYLWQVSNVTMQKYQTEHLEKEIKNLQVKNQSLKIQVAQLQSIVRVQEFSELNMQSISQIAYLPIITSEVAIKK